MKKLIIAALLLLVWVGSAMGYISTVDNGTTIVVTCPDDTITFTIATENAVLKEANSLRAHVQDDNGHWYVYSGMMFNYGTAQTGMSGNDYSRQVITGNWSWYPLNSANNTNASNITTALQDQALTSSPDAVTDLVIPDTIGSSGFASDGAIHVEPTSKEAEFTNDITRHKQAVAFEDPHIYTGATVSGATDHLIFWDKMDSITNGHSPEVGTGTVTVGGSPSQETGTRGNAANFDASSDNFSIAQSGNIDIGKGAIIFNYKNTSTSWASYTYLFYGAGAFRLRRDSDTQIRIHSQTFSGCDNVFDGEWHQIHIAWDFDTDFVILIIDGAIQGTGDPGTEPTFSTFYIGNDSSGSMCNGTIDNFRIYDDVLIPYGAYFTGNGSVDTDLAHDDVTAFIKGDESNSDSLKIGTGTITLSGADHDTDVAGTANAAFDYTSTNDYVLIPYDSIASVFNDQGSISFWYRNDGGAAGSWQCLLCNGSNYSDLYIARTNTGYLRVYYGTELENNLDMSSWPVDMFDGNWHHHRYVFKSSDYFRIYLDGKFCWEDTSISTACTWGTEGLRIGNYYSGGEFADGPICDIYITNNPDTPQIPTIMGKPVHVPLIEVD
jgi:hypothetical protein